MRCQVVEALTLLPQSIGVSNYLVDNYAKNELISKTILGIRGTSVGSFWQELFLEEEPLRGFQCSAKTPSAF